MNELIYRELICKLAIYKDILGKEDEQHSISELADWIYQIKDEPYIQYCRYTPYFSAFDSYEDTLYSVSSFWRAVKNGVYKNCPTFDKWQKSGTIEDTVYKFGTDIRQLIRSVRNKDITKEEIEQRIYGLLHS